jgi:hypothetical protein
MRGEKRVGIDQVLDDQPLVFQLFLNRTDKYPQLPLRTCVHDQVLDG